MYSKVSTVPQNVEDQHNIPHWGISISFKYFLTNDKDSIVDCNTPESINCDWELCCQGDPAPIWAIKHLGVVQNFLCLLSLLKPPVTTSAWKEF